MLYALNGVSSLSVLKYRGIDVAWILEDPDTGKKIIRIDPPRDLTPAVRGYIMGVVQSAVKAMIEGLED